MTLMQYDWCNAKRFCENRKRIVILMNKLGENNQFLSMANIRLFLCYDLLSSSKEQRELLFRR